MVLPHFTPGAKRALLEGDSAKEGFYSNAPSVPGRIQDPATHTHTHPQMERVTVISGALHIGMGEKFDQSAGRALPAGSFFNFSAVLCG